MTEKEESGFNFDAGLDNWGSCSSATAESPPAAASAVASSSNNGTSKHTDKKNSNSKKDSNNKGSKEKPVDLGFAEDITEDDDDDNESWRLTSPFFPSKLGGKPSWLDLKDIPDFHQLKCSSCDGPTKFLLQIYAPLEYSETFHRSIFIFVCTKQTCCVEKNSSKNLIALRCQLERRNEFYSDEAPSYENSKLADEITSEKWNVKLCRVCGGKGVAHCSKCKKISYCGKEHQTLDWKNGHKEECENPDFKPEPAFLSNQHTFKEYEITIEKEILPKITGKNKKDTLEEYKKLVQEGKAGTLSGEDGPSAKELLEAASYKSDKAFNQFRKRIAANPDQILRYNHHGEPLWVSSEHVPSQDNPIPPCQYCGSVRTFEFQVMPQLLNYLGEESRSGFLDWGTFAVYTCDKSCSGGIPYKNEFIWLQHFQDTSIDD